MSLRPATTRWFELLTTREDLTGTVEALARTGAVELETGKEPYTPFSLQQLQDRLIEFNRLTRKYHPYWPEPARRAMVGTLGPGQVLDSALKQLNRWEKHAAPLIFRLETLATALSELGLLEDLLSSLDGDIPDLSLLTSAGPIMAGRLFVLPVRVDPGDLPKNLLTQLIHADTHWFVLAVGLQADLDALGVELAAMKGRVVQIPASLGGSRVQSLDQVRDKRARLEKRVAALGQEIQVLSGRYRLADILGDIGRLDWFLSNVNSLPVSDNFVWVTGWTSDLDDRQLRAALASCEVRILLHYPEPPVGIEPPLVMRNPGWARPFELFAGMLGTPSAAEADPSRLLVFIVPILFGYMFGDVGQGLVLMVAGIALQRRWPVLRILAVNGCSAMLFGFLFGSVFGREDILPALWVHPVHQPLPVLLVPLAGGMVILLLGLLLNAAGQYWRGDIRRWWQTDAAIMILYPALVASLFDGGFLIIAAAALVWFFAGNLAQPGESILKDLLVATGKLLEGIFQLLANTVSFIRVGAFALAHGGLSLAFNTMAEAVDGPVAAIVILALGNIVVIMLEGLIVTIQTTRLVLFEFFMRFLRASGRVFHPLPAPEAGYGIRRTM